MPCHACGVDLPPGAKFCVECGAPQRLTCPGCSSPVEPEQKFCGECGSALVAAASVAHAERRLVTVLFCDLVGFTALSEHRDSEEVRDMLEQYFDRCRALVGRYGGVVEKFIGDAVMAVWGTPVAREDDAERAVRAALEIVSVVGETGITVRAGVLTGEAAVTPGAETEGMVIGDAVNTASRIQALAEPGTVLVEDGTRRASERAIAYADAGTHAVKGREQPVNVWRALRVVAGRGGAGRGSGLEAPFVGRAAELRQIIDGCDAVLAGGSARMIPIIGDAGLGKSRLAWEFEKHVDGIADKVLWHRGRCLSYGEGVSFWALAEMVRGRADILENEPAASAREKLRACVEEFVADERERALILPRLEHLLGLADRAVDAADLFSGWRLFFERLSEADPVVMVVEDLQWADSGLLDFLDHLMEWSADRPILLLALGRPELLERRPAWSEHGHLLRPFPDEDMRALLSGLIPGLPDEASARIRARSEGIPLYAVETVRMLLDRGMLHQEGDAYVVSGDLDEITVPETLHALVAARLDGLSPIERRVLQDAAVLGDTFMPAGVAELAELSQEETLAVMDRLVAKQVLGRVDDQLSPERGQYTFLQALLKTVAYGTLARKDRKRRHLAAAAHLERAWSEGGEDYAEVLATHYVEAVRAEPEAGDAAALRARATDTLAEAGRRAMSFGLGSEARRWYQRAAELAETPVRQAELLDNAGRGAVLAGEQNEARAAFEQASAIFDQHGDARAAAVVRARTVEVYLTLGGEAEGVEVLRDTLAVLGDDPVDPDAAFVAAQLARLQINLGHMEQAVAHASRALAYAEFAGDRDLLAHLLITKGTAMDLLGSRQEGLALQRRGLEIALAEDRAEAALRAYNNMLYPLMRQGRYEEALSLAADGVALAEMRGDRPLLVSLQFSALDARIARGDWDDALRVVPGVDGWWHHAAWLASVRPRVARGEEIDRAGLERHAQAVTERDPIEGRANAAVARATVALRDGDSAGALAELEPTVELVLAQQLLLVPLHVLLDAAAAAGRPDAGEEAIARIAPQGARYDSAEWRGHVERFRGTVAGDADRLDRASEHFREAGTPFELGRTLLARAELGGPGAQARRDEAVAIFESLRAAPWLERARGDRAAV